MNLVQAIGPQDRLPRETGGPPFYEKPGGRLVTNRFVSGDSPDNPFWDARPNGQGC